MEDAVPITVDRAAIEALGVEVVERPLASETLNYARHSFARLSAAVMDIYRGAGGHPYFLINRARARRGGKPCPFRPR